MYKSNSGMALNQWWLDYVTDLGEKNMIYKPKFFPGKFEKKCSEIFEGLKKNMSKKDLAILDEICPPMPKCKAKLEYFKLHGRSAGIRLILDYCNVDYDNCFVENWPEVKPNYHWGALP